MADGSSSIFNNKLRHVIPLLLFNNDSTSAVGYELSIIISYPTSASGINLLKTPTKSRLISSTAAFDMSARLSKLSTRERTGRSKNLKHDHFSKLTGILGFYTAGQLEKTRR